MRGGGGLARLGRTLFALVLLGGVLLGGMPAGPLPLGGEGGGVAGATAAWAAPVDWQEVPANTDGRQWWDAGSLRVNREGRLSVLSRFQPAAPGADTATAADAPGSARGGRPPAARLYVMELDCGQDLYRDISVNGLPRFGAEWQPSEGDDLTDAVVHAACAAGAPLLPS